MKGREGSAPPPSCLSPPAPRQTRPCRDSEAAAIRSWLIWAALQGPESNPSPLQGEGEPGASQGGRTDECPQGSTFGKPRRFEWRARATTVGKGRDVHQKPPRGHSFVLLMQGLFVFLCNYYSQQGGDGKTCNRSPIPIPLSLPDTGRKAGSDRGARAGIPPLGTKPSTPTGAVRTIPSSQPTVLPARPPPVCYLL